MTDSRPDYYKILGVLKEADDRVSFSNEGCFPYRTFETIKRAYRKLGRISVTISDSESAISNAKQIQKGHILKPCVYIPRE